VQQSGVVAAGDVVKALEDYGNLYRDVSVAVLGGAGFIGRWVARALSARGARVLLVDRRGQAAAHVLSRYGIRGTVVEVNLGDAGEVSRLFREVRPSITFNLAGYGVDRTQRDERTAYRINAELVRDVCEASAGTRDAAWTGQDVVHVGTAAEYGDLSGRLPEDDPANPTTVYGKSKLEGTNALTSCCRRTGLKGMTARLFTVYGPGEAAGRLLPALLEAARTGTPVQLTAGTQRRDFTYVEDVAEGLLRLGAATAEPGRIVNLATGRLTSVRAFAETAADVLGISPDGLLFGALPHHYVEMEHAEVDVTRLRRMTGGWAPPTLVAAGIRRTADFRAADSRFPVIGAHKE